MDHMGMSIGTPGYHTIQNEGSQEDVWGEFKNHFKNPKRKRGLEINHHDFLDSSFLEPKVRAGSIGRGTFFSQVGGNALTNRAVNNYSFNEEGSAVNLGRERLF